MSTYMLPSELSNLSGVDSREHSKFSGGLSGFINKHQ